MPAATGPAKFLWENRVLHRRRNFWCSMLAVVSLLSSPCFGADSSPTPFELKDGDRVVLLGNTLIEREQLYGEWETMLTAAWPERNVTFRNLGWSGDTVWADSRGIFDDPVAGYAKMLEQVKGLNPTVVILGYGGNESFAGKNGLPTFLAQLDKLLKDLEGFGVKRFVFLSPNRHENLGAPLPDPAPANANLAIYTAALREVAAKRNAPFVNLFSTNSDSHLTDNGLHFTAKGYRETARVLQKSLGIPADRWEAAINSPQSAEGKQHTKLQEAIVEKNFLYFQNWRPQNVTYLFLFRKHEQGNNAGEVEEFEKLVEQQEKKIAEIRKQLAASPTADATKGK